MIPVQNVFYDANYEVIKLDGLTKDNIKESFIGVITVLHS